ncbi:c-type cytochrome [Mucilaginibacter sp.]|uniref:c-type cytochrome n=1 Tax=Mucilaginibacter sp. TaxID=1882438 RepID=UPI0035BBA9AF
MKKIFIILGIALTIAACGGSKPGEAEGGSEADSASANHQAAAAHQSDAAQDTAVSDIGTTKAAGTPDNKGQELMANSDCNTCHNEKSKIIGPALVDIAKKYTSKDEETLAKKVIAGGSGNWGTVPMTAHPQLSLDDAKTMVRYVLSVK